MLNLSRMPRVTAVFGVGGVIEGLTLGDLLVFFTACEKVPVLGFDPHLSLHFNSMDSYPTASTCAHELVLPSKYHEDSAGFKQAMTTGLLCYGGYGGK